MPDDKKAKVLEFLRARQQAREVAPPDPMGLYFGLYPLHREDGVMLSLPLFELILLRLAQGDLDARTLAASLAETAGTVIPKPV